jgi:hypothetical protein
MLIILYQEIQNHCFVSFWQYWGWSSGPQKASALPLEPHPQHFCFYLFFQIVSHTNFAYTGLKPRASWVAGITAKCHHTLSFVLFVDTESLYIVHSGFEFTILCLSFPSTEIADMCHHAQPESLPYLPYLIKLSSPSIVRCILNFRG